ncbi:MAG: flagellar biosynthesis anti-sigma factor FlgM [Clostridia bacterium]|nr:flagellar biosynthesis anti-sigma factor FlgM [Clostridia bacterium]
MKVNGLFPADPAKVANLYKRSKVEVERKNEASSDMAEISERAKELGRLDSGVPATRKERVQEIRTRLVEGTYHVPPEKVAESILKALKEEQETQKGGR